MFVRTFLTIFIPYPTRGIIESNEVDAMEVEKLLERVDFDIIKGIFNVYLFIQEFLNIEELIHYILDYFSKNLFQQDKFEKLLTIFTIT